MNFKDFMAWALQALIAGSVVYGVSAISEMQQSVESLNVNVAVILKNGGWYEKTLDNHETRITDLEHNKRR